MKNICVFAASSRDAPEKYHKTASSLGRMMAERGYSLVYGGGEAGLMGSVAKGVKELGGRVIGVIPEKLNLPGIAFCGCDELIVTDSMHERKSTMERLSGAYIALPGGFGTLEELLEVITLKQLGYHNSPIVVLNEDGFYDMLLGQFESCVRENFTKDVYINLFYSAKTESEALDFIENHVPVKYPDKLKEALRHG
ncbi:MAG: LOG family protein YvdD [Firmicutes bacterium ADurb.Bin182]|nr:MAG: LOG family protein YvdD [Firmicutes bacterium ADurb.Bin182]